MAVQLRVGDRFVKSTEVTYEDLVTLYQSFIDTNGRVPITTDCVGRNNLPQMRIINRVLSDRGVTYNDFINAFGKVSHVRTESSDYEYFLCRYKNVSDEIGRALMENELINNRYGLPSAQWFVKYCPDRSVRTYDQFVLWCGYESNRLKKWTKDEVASILIELQSSLDRPIKRSDIRTDNTGFSMIVINRLYGGLNNAKSEIGLAETLCTQPKPIEYYQRILKLIIEDFIKTTGRNRITWRDIESGLYGNLKVNHKTLYRAFGDAGINLYSYIKSIGCDMNDDKFSFKYTFDDGERVRSSMEYDFTQYLRSIGYVYGRDYVRDVKYSEYFDIDSKIDCDYVININGLNLFVEVAGIIFRPSGVDFSTYDYGAKRQNEYRNKMILKRRVLEEMGVNYLFLFSNDMNNETYIKLFEDYVDKMNAAA